MNLRDKYTHAIQTAKNFRMDGSAQERDGKLHFTGTVASEAEKNAIWDAIKTVPDWRNEVVADIKVSPKTRRRRARYVDEDLHGEERGHAEQDFARSSWAMRTTTCASSMRTRIS